MARSITVRNLDEDVIARLKIRAAKNGRSSEAEVRAILARVVVEEPAEDFWAAAARVRKGTAGRVHTPSEALTRESRDER